MSAESANKPANPSVSKKRSFGTISNRKPQHFTFPNHNVAKTRQRPPHDFSAVPNETIKKYYGHINTPKGGKHSGQKTRRHRTRRNRRS